IKEVWPEISDLLFEALSQAQTLSGRNRTSFWKYSSTCRVASDLTVMLPSSSTSCAPCAVNTTPLLLMESVQVLIGKPKGYPALKHFSAALRKYSQVQASVSSLSGGPTGYIFCTSSSTYCLKRSIRAHGGNALLP